MLSGAPVLTADSTVSVAAPANSPKLSRKYVTSSLNIAEMPRYRIDYECLFFSVTLLQGSRAHGRQGHEHRRLAAPLLRRVRQNSRGHRKHR